MKFSNNPLKILRKKRRNLVHVLRGTRGRTRTRKEREPPPPSRATFQPPNQTSPRFFPEIGTPPNPHRRITPRRDRRHPAMGSRLRESIRKSLLLYFPQVEGGQAAKPKREKEREREGERRKRERKRERERSCSREEVQTRVISLARS